MFNATIETIANENLGDQFEVSPYIENGAIVF